MHAYQEYSNSFAFEGSRRRSGLLSATSTPWAPWYAVPADHKSAPVAFVRGIIVDAIDQMSLKSPEVAADGLATLAKAKVELFAEE